MKTLLISISFLISTSVFSQNIVNTLGTSGVFSIKDASSNYLTLTQSNGQVNILRNLRLENTTSSSLGVLFKGNERFMHNYGSLNMFIGINSGNFSMTTDPAHNTGVGHSTLMNLPTGAFNTALGFKALFTNTTGSNNTALGVNSLLNNTIGDAITAVGLNTFYHNTTGVNSTAVGVNALYNNTDGSYNDAVGVNSLYNNTIGNSNIALGNRSLFNNVSGDHNIAIGVGALDSSTTGGNNIGIGTNTFNTLISGNNNTALGVVSGTFLSSGSNNTVIGYDAEPLSSTTSNQITLGNTSISSLRCNVQVITSLSDMRDKKNIKDLNFGIDFIMKLKPRQFNWDKREWYEGDISDGSKISETPTAGFIAQELDQVQTTQNADWLNLVLKSNPDRMEASYGNLLPVMVKAIQDLKTENDELREEIGLLKTTNEKIVKLEQMLNELTYLKRASLIESKENMKNSK
ncbi:MAG: tail fiber domain-containing protein [Ignavibacteria bacterium]|nr:tail fiber domain-containing protein [Ignavibacteria bacterium]